jgi:hypothetical protein
MAESQVADADEGNTDRATLIRSSAPNPLRALAAVEVAPSSARRETDCRSVNGMGYFSLSWRSAFGTWKRRPSSAPHGHGRRELCAGRAAMTSLAPHIEAFLREHLARHRGASPWRGADRRREDDFTGRQSSPVPREPAPPS